MRSDRNANPFEPSLETAPLRLTLDARSFEDLTGEAREQADFLCDLCRTEGIDGLFGWEGRPIASWVPQTELRPQNDDRAVGLVGEPHGFIGGVPIWSQYPSWCDELDRRSTDEAAPSPTRPCQPRDACRPCRGG